MEFDGPPPPMNDTYFPSLFSEELWKQIEQDDIDYSEDLRGWKKKLEDEREHIDAHTASQAADVARWMDETDYAIRMLRCVEEVELAQHYIDQAEGQRKYGEKVQERRELLERKILDICGLIDVAVRAENNNLTKKPQAESGKKHGKVAETAKNK